MDPARFSGFAGPCGFAMYGWGFDGAKVAAGVSNGQVNKNGIAVSHAYMRCVDIAAGTW